jgi:hypothetical protein
MLFFNWYETIRLAYLNRICIEILIYQYVSTLSKALKIIYISIGL